MDNVRENKQMQRGNRRDGRDHNFTLIELLVVIAMIAISVASKAGFFLLFSANFAFSSNYNTNNNN